MIRTLSCACLQYGCLVVNAPTANTVAAAEHGIALMTALARNVAQADASMKASKWERTKYVGVSLVDKVLAIMGFGKVRGDRGWCWRQAVCCRFLGVGLCVVEGYLLCSAGVECVGLETCLYTCPGNHGLWKGEGDRGWWLRQAGCCCEGRLCVAVSCSWCSVRALVHCWGGVRVLGDLPVYLPWHSWFGRGAGQGLVVAVREGCWSL
jgi:hypothetical protein